MKYSIVIIFFGILFMGSCSVEPQPIKYGVDACHSCKMGIVQQKFGAEIVTKKGKIYKYDAIECAMQDILENWDENKLEYILVIDYNNPTNLIDATKAFHLKSEKLPSPMGAYLSSYVTLEMAQTAKEKDGGEVMDWNTLKERFTESD
jgi:copper chaperone NosL